MSRPALLVARSDTPAYLLAGSSLEDDETPYSILAHTNRLAPQGIGGECIFTNVYLTVRYFVPTVVLSIVASVDGKLLSATTLSVGGGADTGTVKEYEISLMQPYLVGGVEQLRYAPRGTWIEVIVSILNTGALNKVDVGGVEVEWEPVRESRVAVTG